MRLVWILNTAMSNEHYLDNDKLGVNRNVMSPTLFKARTSDIAKLYSSLIEGLQRRKQSTTTTAYGTCGSLLINAMVE